MSKTMKAVAVIAYLLFMGLCLVIGVSWASGK